MTSTDDLAPCHHKLGNVFVGDYFSDTAGVRSRENCAKWSLRPNRGLRIGGGGAPRMFPLEFLGEFVRRTPSLASL